MPASEALGNGNRHYHLIGAAGVGMSALAELLLDMGFGVSGSDRYADLGVATGTLRKLRDAGVAIAPQDGRGIPDSTEAVVVSAAIEQDNPDLREARRRGIPVLGRAELLARLSAGRRLIGVTGTSGKTTVTGMTGWVLERLGFDPTVVNGGSVIGWETPQRTGSVRTGRSAWWVAELDESDRSLLHFQPEYAILTNISTDHFGLDEVTRLFQTFEARVARDVVRPLDPAALSDRFACRATAGGFRFEYGGALFELRLPGLHNVANALQVAMLCERLGAEPRAVAEALGSFQGIRRRLEKVGMARGITVLDDYAHNPAKIRASWLAVQPPRDGRLLAVWRPHGFGPLALLYDELVRLFTDLCRPPHRLHLLPAYYVGGTADRRVTADRLAQALRDRSVPVTLAAGYDELLECLAAEAHDGDTILSMGARDPELPLFARRLLARLQT